MMVSVAPVNCMVWALGPVAAVSCAVRRWPGIMPSNRAHAATAARYRCVVLCVVAMVGLS